MPDNTPPPVAAPEETAKYVSEQTKEYGQFVAVADISFNGVKAYNAGDPVPASNVAKYGYDTDGLVAKAGTKAAGNVVAALHTAATASAEPVVSSPVSLNVAVPSTK